MEYIDNTLPDLDDVENVVQRQKRLTLLISKALAPLLKEFKRAEINGAMQGIGAYLYAEEYVDLYGELGLCKALKAAMEGSSSLWTNHIIRLNGVEAAWAHAYGDKWLEIRALLLVDRSEEA